MSFAKIRPRRGTASQWTTIDPVLAEGEIGIEVPDSGVGTGKVKIKFGDGVKKWSELPYGILEADEPLEEVVIFSNIYPASGGTEITLSEPIDSYEYLYLCETQRTGSRMVGARTYISGQDLKDPSFYNPYSQGFASVYLLIASNTVNMATLQIYSPDTLKLKINSSASGYSGFTLLGYKKKEA